MDALLRLTVLVERMLSAVDGAEGGGVCPETMVSPPVGGVECASRRAEGGGGAVTGGVGGSGVAERGRQ